MKPYDSKRKLNNTLNSPINVWENLRSHKQVGQSDKFDSNSLDKQRPKIKKDSNTFYTDWTLI